MVLAIIIAIAFYWVVLKICESVGKAIFGDEKIGKIIGTVLWVIVVIIIICVAD